MFSRRNIVIISTLLLTAITFIVCFSALSKSASSGDDKNGITIVLDAGHGGIDGGVTGVKTGVKESDLNLAIVKKLESYLIAGGFNVVLTRSTDAGLYGVATANLKKKDMQKRKEIISNAKPTVMVSIHLNQFSYSSRSGAQVFYKSGNDNSEKLANCLQKTFNNLETSKRDYSPLTGDYYILNCTEYTSVIAECGFLSNPEEERLLMTEEYQKTIAYAVFQGIVDYLSVSSIVFCD